MDFIDFRFLDFLDILIFTFILYQAYMLIRGTVAMKIFVGILTLYLLWILVKALNMQLLSSIMGQITGVGVVALLIVFQQEIRKFFLFIGTNYLTQNKFSIESLFHFIIKPEPTVDIYSVLNAVLQMAKDNTGAIIIIERESELGAIAQTGTLLDAKSSSQLIKSIFFKNSPLHDGALIIRKDRLLAAACVLPLSKSTHLPEHFGLRHRSAAGLTEQTDAFVIAVSEERGSLSVFLENHIIDNIKPMELRRMLKEFFIGKPEVISPADYFSKSTESIKEPLQKLKQWLINLSKE
jgi:uncharacterized protein (TIGR00159 family)